MKLIDADLLITELDAWAVIINKPKYYAREDAIHIIDTAPIIDAVPVVHGEWKNNSNDYPQCTNCGYMPMFDPHIDDIYYSPYCPNCGAKMEDKQ